MILDAVDKKILNMLLESGRISYTDIAKAVNMKPPSIIERVKKLEKEGIIEGYTTKVDYKKLGYDLNAYVGVVVDDPDQVGTLEKRIANINPGIIQCYHVTGEFTLMLKVVTENTTTLATLIKSLRALPGVTKTNTILIFSTILETVRSVE